MIELKSAEQMKRAITKAKKIRPFVRVIGFRWYEVASADGRQTYTIHFRKQDGRRLGECNCKGGQKGLVCYHLAASAAVHIGIAAMRQKAA
jgi:hypothetical protein